MKVIATKREINAPIEKVWGVMTQIEKYPEWNPFIVKIDSNKSVPTIATKMLFYIEWFDGSKTTSGERVTVFNPPDFYHGKSAKWEYIFDSFLSTIGMVKAHRYQHLTFKDGLTTYETAETFRGWGTAFLPVKKIERGFEDQADALKEYCEK